MIILNTLYTSEYITKYTTEYIVKPGTLSICSVYLYSKVKTKDDQTEKLDTFSSPTSGI